MAQPYVHVKEMTTVPGMEGWSSNNGLNGTEPSILVVCEPISVRRYWEKLGYVDLLDWLDSEQLVKYVLIGGTGYLWVKMY